MAAGTPVVGFGAGGVPEMIEDQRNGWLCAPGDQIGLARKLRDALTCTNLSSFSLAAQQSVRDRFGVESFVERHLKIYRRMTIGS
jgi:glycosyltransferase involved in cell wall biosynthesis